MGLRNKTISSFLWTSFGTFGSGIIGFLVTIVLARFLTPEDFGIVEIVLSLVVISEVLVDCGFTKAIIREEDVLHKDLSTVFFLNMAIAILLYAVIFLLAPILSSVYSAGENFIRILRVLSLKIIVDACAVCPTANCNRDMQFNLLAKVSVVSMILAGGGSFVAIYLGMGIWSLVVYYLALSVCKTVLIVIFVKWYPRWEFDLLRAKQFVRFGISLMVGNIVDRGVTSLESLLVGKAFSKGDLGYFSQARKFDSLIIQNLVGIISKVTYPALSKLSEPEKLVSGYRDVMGVSIFAITPVAVFMFFNAENVMTVVFGEQWLPAAKYLQMFSVFSMIVPLYFICHNIFFVKNETRLWLKLTMIMQVVRLIVIIITINISMDAFVLGIVCVMVCSAIMFMYRSGQLINYTLLKMLRDNAASIICSLFSVVATKLIISELHIESNLLHMILSVCVVSIMYLLSNKVLKNRIVDLCFTIVKSFFVKTDRKV